MRELTFWQTLVAALKSLVIKCVSFKNIGFAVGTVTGVILAREIPGTTFTQWSIHMLTLIALFFTTNQVQKYLLGLLLRRGHGTETEGAG